MSDSKIRVIAGLGNPGAKYGGTRHNAGFETLDLLARQHAPSASWRVREGAEICEIKIGNDPVLLIKPIKFMNLSGLPIQSLLAYYKVPTPEMAVCHDDLDLNLGALRLKFGGGDGGHNGIRSIVESLGSKDFARVKIGIGRPINTESEDAVSSYVLGKFTKEERQLIDGILQRSVQALEKLVAEGLKRAQNLFNC